jgi:AraC-like DNA-binding protein
VWLPAAVAHAHQAYGATQLRTVAFPVDVNPLGLTQPTVLSVSRLLRELIIAITDYPARPGTGQNGTGQDGAEQDDLKRVALHQLRRAQLRPAQALQLHLPQPGDERLRDVTAILAEDPGSDRTLAELGRAVGAGERTLSRLFRAETGMTFPQWRAQLRLHHSLTLLATGLSVTATAITCGYSTPSAFTAAFGTTFGTTPGAYRKDLSRPATPPTPTPTPTPAPGELGGPPGTVLRTLCATDFLPRSGVVAAGLGPVAAHAHVTPAAAGVLGEVEEQPAAVPLARAFPDPVDRPVRQEFRGRPGNRPEHLVKRGTAVLPLPGEACRGPADPQVRQSPGQFGLQHAEVVRIRRLPLGGPAEQRVQGFP